MELQNLLDELIEDQIQGKQIKVPDGSPVNPILYKENKYGPAVSTLVLASLGDKQNKQVISNEYCSWDPNSKTDEQITYKYGGVEYKLSRPMLCLINSVTGELNKVNKLTNEFVELRNQRAVDIVTESSSTEESQTIRDLRIKDMNRREYARGFNNWITFFITIVFCIWLFTVIYLGIVRKDSIMKDLPMYIILPGVLLILIGYGYQFINKYTFYLGI